jgi:hypothetical protein
MLLRFRLQRLFSQQLHPLRRQQRKPQRHLPLTSHLQHLLLM